MYLAIDTESPAPIEMLQARCPELDETRQPSRGHAPVAQFLRIGRRKGLHVHARVRRRVAKTVLAIGVGDALHALTRGREADRASGRLRAVRVYAAWDADLPGLPAHGRGRWTGRAVGAGGDALKGLAHEAPPAIAVGDTLDALPGRRVAVHAGGSAVRVRGAARLGSGIGVGAGVRIGHWPRVANTGLRRLAALRDGAGLDDTDVGQSRPAFDDRMVRSVEHPLVRTAGALRKDEHGCGRSDRGSFPHGAPASTASASARANPFGYRAR